MRSISLFSVLVCLGACAAGPRIVATANDTAVSIAAVADACADADLVALGELHETPDVHRTHLKLIKALHRRRPNLAIAMEMFERDVQPVMTRYVSNSRTIDEDQFRAEARPWPHYVRDYRPVVEYARANGLMVLCANAPKELVTKARKQGLEAVLGEKHVAREVSVPEDDGYESFMEAMAGHPGVTREDLHAFYVAQCVRDDTMGETIADWLREHADDSEPPLVVLICGRQHSDYGRGVVQRVRNRLPDIKVKVLTAETVADLGAGVYETDRKAADYVVVAREPERRTRTLPPVTEKGEGGQSSAQPGEGEAEAESMPTENPEGLRPALGFMPDYASSAAGVGVGEVREGGPAAKAGIQQGDVITSIAGVEVADLQEYTDVLDGLIIGRTVTVHVVRGDAAFDTEVKVGSRPGH